MWWCARIMALVLITVGFTLPAATQAQQQSQYFPETGYTVNGRFLEYWQEHGGLAVFGLPLSPEMNESGLTVQYFERQRFEYSPGNARPYDVLLGRLGAQLWGPAYAPTASGPVSGCIYFPETQHNVCNQAVSLGFASSWQTNGLEFDGLPAGKSYGESLALFGFPITEAIEYTTRDGTRVLAQWFERARFEWHPENPDAYKVLLGRLGAEVLPAVPPPGPALVDQVQIFLINVGDTTSGNTIGCGDAAVPTTLRIEPTAAPLGSALEQLFSIKDQYYGESGLYNALYQSDLSIERLDVTNGVATVSLVGTVQLGGVCDTPRVQAQIEETARQFPSVTSVAIFLNGQPLADALSER